MADLGSAPVPPIGPGDHARGSGPEAILYLDLACPHCAADWARVSGLELRLCVRHFPVASVRPRSPALHAATEAAHAQGGEDAFWWFWDSLLADRGHQDDPHLWARARELGLDLERFERDRRSDRVAERVGRDKRSGIRAGVVGTPSAFLAGRLVVSGAAAALTELATTGAVEGNAAPRDV